MSHAVVTILHNALFIVMSCRYRIGPFEVESCLLEHPAVAESAVVSSPDSQRGEVVKAFVILAEGYKDTDPATLISSLQQHVKENTAPYKYPRKVCQDNVRTMLQDRNWTMCFLSVYSINFNLHTLFLICELSS